MQDIRRHRPGVPLPIAGQEKLPIGLDIVQKELKRPLRRSGSLAELSKIITNSYRYMSTFLVHFSHSLGGRDTSRSFCELGADHSCARAGSLRGEQAREFHLDLHRVGGPASGAGTAARFSAITSQDGRQSSGKSLPESIQKLRCFMVYTVCHSIVRAQASHESQDRRPLV